MTQRDIAIPGAPLDADGGEVTLPVTFRQKPTRLGLEGATFSRVRDPGDPDRRHRGRHRSVVPAAAAHHRHLAQAEAAGRAPIEVVDYQRAADGEVGPTLALPSRPPADVTELWQDSSMLFTLEITGQLPTVAWSADVGLSFGATITY